MLSHADFAKKTNFCSEIVKIESKIPNKKLEISIIDDLAKKRADFN